MLVSTVVSYESRLAAFDWGPVRTLPFGIPRSDVAQSGNENDAKPFIWEQYDPRKHLSSPETDGRATILPFQFSPETLIKHAKSTDFDLGPFSVRSDGISGLESITTAASYAKETDAFDEISKLREKVNKEKESEISLEKSHLTIRTMTAQPVLFPFYFAQINNERDAQHKNLILALPGWTKDLTVCTAYGDLTEDGANQWTFPLQHYRKQSLRAANLHVRFLPRIPIPDRMNDFVLFLRRKFPTKDMFFPPFLRKDLEQRAETALAANGQIAQDDLLIQQIRRELNRRINNWVQALPYEQLKEAEIAAYKARLNNTTTDSKSQARIPEPIEAVHGLGDAVDWENPRFKSIHDLEVRESEDVQIFELT